VCVYEKLFIVDGRATKTRQKRDKNENCLVYFIKRRQAEASRATPCVLLYLCEPHVSGSLCMHLYSYLYLGCSRQLEDGDNADSNDNDDENDD